MSGTLPKVKGAVDLLQITQGTNKVKPKQINDSDQIRVSKMEAICEGAIRVCQGGLLKNVKHRTEVKHSN